MIKISAQSSRKYKVWKKLEDRYKSEKKRVMRQIGNSGVQEIKNELTKREIKNRSGNLRKNIVFKINKDDIIWESNASYHQYINDGVRPHVMTYLLKSRRPIPIRLGGGNRKFRWATAKSMNHGAWKHPGFMRGKDYFQTAVKRNIVNSQKKFLYLSKLFK